MRSPNTLTKSKKRTAVQVVQCPSAFPISKKSRKSAAASKPSSVKADSPRCLDFDETSREIRRFGATGFEKKDRKAFEDEEYERLTGRKRKQPKTPLPILRGMKRKAKEREEKLAKEAKEAGIVTATPTLSRRNNNKKRSKDAMIHGPAPSVGFVARGVLRVNPKRR